MKRAFWCIFLLVCIDALSKWWVHAHLAPMQWAPGVYPYGGIGVFSNFFGIEFSLVHVTNRGAAWGQLANWHLPLLLVRICVVAALGIYMIRAKKATLPMLFILSGALGNIFDCLVYGYVIDMFNFIFWGYAYPVFNVADSAICVGAVCLILSKRKRIAYD